MTSRYINAHKPENLAGPGDSRPTAQQIVDDNDLRNKLTGKVALITGCSSGIGIETARALKTTGMTLYCTVRDRAKGEKALSDILEPGRVELLLCDQNSLASVNSCADDFLAKSSTLNLLINNAGIMANPTRDLTADGHEAQFGVNHLAHFLLFQRLKHTLLKSATADFPSRVVSVSSSGHRRNGINFDDLRFDKPDSYQPFIAYGQAKTANIYLANEIERRYGSQNLHANSLHPGGIMTGLQIHMDMSAFKDNKEVNKSVKSVEQGAATSVVAAVDRDLHGKGGFFLSDCAVNKPADENSVPGGPGYAEWAFDEEKARRLWEVSCELVGVEDD